jgi:gas vesicle protein
LPIAAIKKASKSIELVGCGNSSSACRISARPPGKTRARNCPPFSATAACAGVNTLLSPGPRTVRTQEHKNMNAHTQEHRDYGFVIGMLAGTFVGAGLMMWLAPRMASELRRQMSDSARSLGKRASEGYQQASSRVGEAVDELTRKGQDVRDDVADRVARGAREVERYATAAKTDRVAEPRQHSAADHAASTPRSL